MTHPLDNIAWHALSGAQAHFAVGAGAVRRYAPGFSPIVGFADPRRPDFDAMAKWCEPAEQFYSLLWTGSPPAGWQVHFEGSLLSMVWTAAAAPDDEAADAVRLDARHAAQALELARLTRPGPFGPRTIELGEYFGFFEGQRLVAMAGERMRFPGFTEVSGVCTHPDFRGQGFARRLSAAVVAAIQRRGERAFLHAWATNAPAITLYRSLGFEVRAEVNVAVLARRREGP